MVYYKGRKVGVFMKKTMFELKEIEVRKVERELLNTSYGKQYSRIIGILLLFPIVLVICDLITDMVYDIEKYLSSGIMFDIAYLFVALLIYIICKLKWLEMIKTYYDEVYSKKKKETSSEK